MRKLIFFLLIGLFHSIFGQPISPDDPGAALDRLLYLGEQAINQPDLAPADRLHTYLDLGLWTEARELVNSKQVEDADWLMARGRFAYLHNEFAQAEKFVTEALAQEKGHLKAHMLRAQLWVEAWELDSAASIYQAHLETSPDALLGLGRVMLYQKAFRKALELSKTGQSRWPEAYQGHLLEAEAWFWLREQAQAESALRRSLELNPFDADARFSYGYAIWRRVDATQLPDMAAQWELALAIQPLHYLTHWHWGNGHTQLTYPDYLDPKEEEIVAALQPSEAMVSDNNLREAIREIDQVARQYPKSVIPLMHRGSVFYMDYGDQRLASLDSAQATFLEILNKKPHFGPAHNGLAAVIKAKRFPYLSTYDSLEAVISQTEIEDPELFLEIFPDMAYYPGDRVQKMIWNQLKSSRAYFPMLKKLKRKFVIPPLHTDLATAMENTYFRGNTTFDNRQWMDIRGVGSGATGIEYVERGAHLERNVTLHEYVHLFHITVFTDAENRKVRELYLHAMKYEGILDYYSANNEHEYLAQTYTAYFAPVKVHPLNHKSVNIRQELEDKDPQLFDFIDELVNKQDAFLAGDSQALADNWADAYLILANQTKDPQHKHTLLDTALIWSPRYVPALHAYADSYSALGEASKSDSLLNLAFQYAPDYAPNYLLVADMVAKGYELTAIKDASITDPAVFLQKAYSQETDPLAKGEAAQELYDYLVTQNRLPEAVSMMKDYAASVDPVSTYLRDQKRSALARAHYQAAHWGYEKEAEVYFEETLAQHPQDYTLRHQYAEVLIAGGQEKRAVELLKEAQQILSAAGNPRIDYALLIVAYDESSSAMLRKVSLKTLAQDSIYDMPLFIRNLAKLGEYTEARQLLTGLPGAHSPKDQAERSYTEAFIICQEYPEKKKSLKMANVLLNQALEVNPYHWPARKLLLQNLDSMGDSKQAATISEAAASLSWKPGPGVETYLEKY